MNSSCSMIKFPEKIVSIQVHFGLNTFVSSFAIRRFKYWNTQDSNHIYCLHSYQKRFLSSLLYIAWCLSKSLYIIYSPLNTDGCIKLDEWTPISNCSLLLGSKTIQGHPSKASSFSEVIKYHVFFLMTEVSHATLSFISFKSALLFQLSVIFWIERFFVPSIILLKYPLVTKKK